tara:strand:- start:362 stop:1009 length:648 start_codon:yes stop_codon:yes gene_type:complete
LLKGVIFDFDGVIVESNKVKSDAFYSLYVKYGKEIAEKVKNHHENNEGLSRFDKIKLYHKKFLNKDVSDKELTHLLSVFSKLVFKRVCDSNFVPGIVEFLPKLKKKYKLFISTGTPTIEINRILKKKKINDYFKRVYGSPDNKEYHIQKIISEFDYEPSQLLFFGDSYLDYKAAKTCELYFILRLHNKNIKLFNDFRILSVNDFKLPNKTLEKIL